VPYITVGEHMNDWIFMLCHPLLYVNMELDIYVVTYITVVKHITEYLCCAMHHCR